jgi:cytochrome c biogenesis protein CcmG/thiol:disulfide interchange protein DsbE
LLAQEVAAKYAGRITFVTENLGASKLAERFGVKGYPAVFLDDVLIVSPREFGYFGDEEGVGRYAPWKNVDSQARYKADLMRMVDLLLAGRKDMVRRENAAEQAAPAGISSLPGIALADLSGRSIDPAELEDRVVLVEFWATWCPPCRSTLDWLGRLKRTHGDRLVVLALAVESKEEDVRSVATALDPDLRWAIADAATTQAFGEITAVPTLFVFDHQGQAASVWYGAPRDLHEQVEKKLTALLDR